MITNPSDFKWISSEEPVGENLRAFFYFEFCLPFGAAIVVPRNQPWGSLAMTWSLKRSRIS